MVRPQGRADTLTADELQAALLAAAAEHSRVALDLTEVDYISSAGLRAVLMGARAAQQHRAEFVVCAATPGVQEVLRDQLHGSLDADAGSAPC